MHCDIKANGLYNINIHDQDVISINEEEHKQIHNDIINLKAPRILIMFISNVEPMSLTKLHPISVILRLYKLDAQGYNRGGEI